MSDDLSGRTLGRYQVLERLGRGGMAEVYRAYQPGLDRFVALKAIYPHLAGDPSLLERFGREARAVAALRHPNIVQVYDFDVQAGSAFMAMEFIAGPTLKRAVYALGRRGRLLPLPVVGRIVGQLADALAYAHDQGLVHRDVKPANVLIRRSPPADAPLDDAAVERLLLALGPADVVLTDFGVARIINDSVEHTAAGTILGSPAYMSPEQGRGERVDRRSDIYSLGVVLYELLTGQLPFDADTPFAIVLKHTTAPLPPPRQLRPDLPASLERVLLKALAKDPADRFQDAAAFGAAVRELSAGATADFAVARPAPVPAPPAGSFETRLVELTAPAPAPADGAAKPAAPEGRSPAPARAPRARRGPVRWLAGCAFTLVVAALVAVVAFFAGGAAIFRGLASSGALVVPTQFQAQATALAATIVADGGRPPAIFATPAAPAADLPPDVAAAIDAAAAACPDDGCSAGGGSRAVALLDAAIAGHPDSAELLVARARAHLRWDLYTFRDEIRADLDRAVALAPDSPEALLARARFLAGSDSFYQDSSPDREQLIADTTALLAAEPANVAALVLRGQANYAGGQYQAAVDDFSAALAHDPSNRAALRGRGDAYRYYLDNPEAARADYDAALAAHPDDLDLREDRAIYAAERGDLATAEADLELLIAAEPADPDRHIARGFVRLALDRPDEAADDFARALQLAGPDNVGARYGRGAAALAADDPDEALPDLQYAAERADELADLWPILYAGHPQVFVDLARAYAAVDSPDEAIAALDTAIAADDEWFLPHLLRARLLRERGDIPAARADLRRALELAATDDERAEVDAGLAALDE